MMVPKTYMDSKASSTKKYIVKVGTVTINIPTANITVTREK
jgi:hypothetical protein